MRNRVSPREHGSQLDQQRAAGPQSGKTELPKGEEGFEKMWEAHPHNYQDEYEENTSSDEVREEEGLPAYLANTCAIRLSVMLNNLGENYRITPAKVKAAGSGRKPMYSKKSGDYYIVAASEMWKYLDKHFRKADALYPKSKTWKNAEEFEAGFEGGDTPVKDIVASKKGIVAFEKIYGYGGTGHVDIFDGLKLSDAAEWYPCRRLHLWYISV